ncbi:MAG: hypothetical protein AUK55_15875 [Syntrophobacteraceae bacterium CG2_30_61_12]|nr:MAG: hypothetical protein AUK55_15875 [Syntrophobacteraceae bacterium CG2_30_61_12]
MTRPRINQRKIDHQARRRRRAKLLFTGLLPVLALGALLGLSAGLSWAYHSLLEADRFRLTQVQISGIERLTPAQVLDALAVPKGINMLNLKMERLRERLNELPWITNAEVRLDLPANLAVMVQERKPLALVEGPPSCLVDQAGTLFLPASAEQYPDLPRLGGFAEARLQPGDRLPSTVTNALKALQAELEAHPIRELTQERSIVAWSLDNGLIWKAPAGDLEIAFGAAGFKVKCARLRWILQRLKSSNRLKAVQKIDLDYRQRAFLTWQDANRMD